MRNRFPIIRIIVIVCFLALLAGVAVFQRISRGEDLELAKLSAMTEQYERPLYARRTELERELRELTAEEQKTAASFGSIVLLYTEPTAQFEELQIPEKLKNYDYSGVLCLSDTYFPGEEGCLSVPYVRSLTENGWELCVTVNGNTDLPALLDRFHTAELPAPSAAYFPDGECADTRREEMMTHGISIVAVRKGTPAISDSFTVLGAIGSYENGSKDDLLAAISDSMPIVITTGFSEEWEIYTDGNHDGLLRTIYDNVSEGYSSVTGFREAAERFASREETISSGFASVAERRAEVQAKLDEVNEQLRHGIN